MHTLYLSELPASYAFALYLALFRAVPVPALPKIHHFK